MWYLEMRTSAPMGLDGLAAGNFIVMICFNVQHCPLTGAVVRKKMEVHDSRPT